MREGNGTENLGSCVVNTHRLKVATVVLFYRFYDYSFDIWNYILFYFVPGWFHGDKKEKTFKLDPSAAIIQNFKSRMALSAITETTVIVLRCHCKVNKKFFH